jgi:hypothetical protein
LRIPYLLPALLMSLSVAGAGQTVTIPGETAIRIRTMQPLSSESARAGDDVPLEVLADVAVDGYVVIRQGAPVIGIVSLAKEAKSLGRRGHIALSLRYAESVTGQHVLISGNRAEKGNGKAAKVTTEVVVATAITPLGLLFLFEKGNDSAIPPGTAFTAFTVADTTLKLPRGTKLVRAAPGGPATVERLGVVLDANPENLFATITGIAHDGPAARAGLKVGYLINSVNHVGMHNISEIIQTIDELPADTGAIEIGYSFKTNLGYMPNEAQILLAKPRDTN